jgi:hypothetical protein
MLLLIHKSGVDGDRSGIGFGATECRLLFFVIKRGWGRKEKHSDSGVDYGGAAIQISSSATPSDSACFITRDNLKTEVIKSQIVFGTMKNKDLARANFPAVHNHVIFGQTPDLHFDDNSHSGFHLPLSSCWF